MSAAPQASQVSIDKATLDELLRRAAAPQAAAPAQVVMQPAMAGMVPAGMVPAGAMQQAQAPAAAGVLLPFRIETPNGELSGYFFFPDVQAAMAALPAIAQAYPIRFYEQRQNGWGGGNGGGFRGGNGWGGNRGNFNRGGRW
jgi:hypothetical protein